MGNKQVNKSVYHGKKQRMAIADLSDRKAGRNNKKQVKQHNIKSSDIKPNVTTKAMNDQMRIQLLTAGFIKQIENKYSFSYKMPDTLAKLICDYYTMHFQFIKHPNCDVTENGLSTSNQEGHYVSIRFGDFLSNKSNCSYIVKFNMTKMYPKYSGIGFMSKQFNDWCHMSWNLGENNSLCLYGNSFFVTSSCFDNMKYHNTDLLGITTKAITRYEQGHDIMVKIDTNKMIAIIWNYTVLKIENMDESWFMQQYNKRNVTQYAFMINLPLDKHEIAIMIELGHVNQQITVKEEWFTLQ
eukprot:551120_1